ncbi:MAG: hypothetical protein QOH52_2313, partial [Pseudonocardiales bacterium]|nr:hypothetical protein [Pseudonocardiales bacterium]
MAITGSPQPTHVVGRSGFGMRQLNHDGQFGEHLVGG